MSLTLRRWVQIMVLVLLAVMLLFIGAVMTSSGESIRTQVSGSYESSMRLYARILEKDLRSVELSVTNLLNDDTKILFQIERDGDVLARQQLKMDFAKNALLASNVDGVYFYRPGEDTQTYQYDIWPLTRTDALIEVLNEDLSDGKAPSVTWYPRKVGDVWCVFRTFAFSESFMGVYVRTEALVGRLRSSDMMAVADYCILDADGSILSSELNATAIDPDKRTVRIGDESYMALNTPILSSQLNLAALVRERELTEPLRRNYWIMSAYILVLVALVILIYRVISRHVLKPVSHLTATMHDFRRGNTDARATEQSSISELNVMIEAFNELANEVVQLKIDNYEIELAKNRATLNFYQLQIRPHFLINALNTIYSLAQVKNTALIQDMAMFLVKYYRYTMKTMGTFVCLKDELEHVRNFLNLHKMRLEDRLDAFFDVDEQCLGIAIPPLVIQTFVENSVEYAVSMDDITFIGVEVHSMPDDPTMVRIVISDTGLGFSEKWLADETEGAGSEHIGIYNVRQRLKIAYEGRAQLHVGNAQPHGARVEILIPRIGFSGEEGASGR